MSSEPKGKILRRKILIRRRGAIGDVLLATSVLQPVKTRFPDHEIDFVTDYPEILEQNPFVHNVLPTAIDISGYDVIYNLDLAYELQPQRGILESYAAVVGIPVTDLHLSIVIPQKAKLKAIQLLNDRGIQDNQKLVAIQTAASFWVKNWAVQGYQLIADVLNSQLKVQPVLLGSLSDPAINGTVDFRGSADIKTSIAILSQCCAFIGVDSLLLHYAKALGIPVAAFFGHSDPKKRIKIDKNDLIFISDIKCRFCHHRLKPPVFVTICQKENLFLQILDTLLQKLNRLYYINDSQVADRLRERLWNHIKWREKGGLIAPCMKRIKPAFVTPKIIQWLQVVLSIQANHRAM